MKAPGSIVALGVAGILAFGGIAAAQPYRWVDARGTVHFTQTPPPATDEAPPRDAGALVDEVLELSGARRALAQIPGQVQAQIQQRKGQLPETDLARLGDIMTRSFSPDALHAGLRESLSKQADPDRLSLVVRFLRSPLARRMTQLELDATAPGSPAEMKKFAERTQASGPPQARLELIQRLDAATGSTEVAVDAAVAVIRAIGKALNAASPQDRRLTARELDGMIEKTKAAMSDSLRAAATLQLLFAYRSAADRELGDYVQFWESDPGRWFLRAFRKGLLEAISAAATSAAAEITRALPRDTAASRPAKTPAR